MKFKRTTTVRLEGEIPSAIVEAALRKALPPDVEGKEVEIWIRVPSGGDWSGMQCDPSDFEYAWVCTYTEESDV